MEASILPINCSVPHACCCTGTSGMRSDNWQLICCLSSDVIQNPNATVNSKLLWVWVVIPPLAPLSHIAVVSKHYATFEMRNGWKKLSYFVYSMWMAKLSVMARHHSSEHLISDCQKEAGDRLRGSQLYYTLGEFGDARFDPWLRWGILNVLSGDISSAFVWK